jgi:hypothetical protein
MKKLLKVARKRAGLKLFDVKGGVAQLRHVPGDCLVQKVLGPEEMLEDGQYITEDGASFERVSVYAEVPGDCLVQKVLRAMRKFRGTALCRRCSGQKKRAVHN